MNSKDIAAKAAAWAIDKVGCQYSQPKRTEEGIFDCSSLVARAYSAQGKHWKYGGSVPRSNQEVYDDDFELLWPESYDAIGKKMGGSSVIALAKQVGDLQFNTLAMQVFRAGQEVPLTRKEYELALLFAQNRGIVLSKSAIYERIWGGEFPEHTRTVELHIQRMKKKLGWTEKIRPVFGMGYRLEV